MLATVDITLFLNPLTTSPSPFIIASKPTFATYAGGSAGHHREWSIRFVRTHKYPPWFVSFPYRLLRAAFLLQSTDQSFQLERILHRFATRIVVEVDVDRGESLRPVFDPLRPLAQLR